MILYRDSKHTERITPPAWLEGTEDLQAREDVKGRLFTIGDGRMLDPAHDRAWSPVEDGMQARLLQPFFPSSLLRKPVWCKTYIMPDLQNRLWPVPQILSKDGSTLAIEVTYGPGWQPELTEHQKQAERAARWARQSISAAVEANTPMTVVDACQAAAELLSSVLHISPMTLSALKLLDQGFVLAVLRTAAGWVPEGPDHA